MQRKLHRPRLMLNGEPHYVVADKTSGDWQWQPIINEAYATTSIIAAQSLAVSINPAFTEQISIGEILGFMVTRKIRKDKMYLFISDGGWAWSCHKSFAFPFMNTATAHRIVKDELKVKFKYAVVPIEDD